AARAWAPSTRRTDSIRGCRGPRAPRRVDRDSTAGSAPLLPELARLVGGCGERVARARLLHERGLDLLLRVAVPLVVPGGLDVRPGARRGVLLAPHLEVPPGVPVDLDHVGVLVERHEG